MIEVRNETNKKIYVALCKTKLGNLYFHIANKKSEHISTLVNPNDYAKVEAKEVGV